MRLKVTGWKRAGVNDSSVERTEGGIEKVAFPSSISLTSQFFLA